MAATPEKSRDEMKRALSAAKPRSGVRLPAIGNVAASLSPDAHKPAAAQPQPVEDTFGYEVAAKLAFVGAGQGGGRIAAAFQALGYRRACAFNTTDSDFAGLPADMPKFSLDVGGASKDTELARKAMQGRTEDVRDLLERSWGSGQLDCVLVCASLGGGTGSGAAPELVKIARKLLEDRGMPVRVGAVISLPTNAEGFTVCRNAVLGFQALMQLKVSPLIVIDNARINALYKPAMARLHPTANETVAQLLHLFNQLAAVHSEYLTFDRSELYQLLDSGIVVMGAADIRGVTSPADVAKAVRDQLGETVLAEVDLRTSHKAACLFVAARQELERLSSDFFEAGYTQAARLLAGEGGEGTVVHRGLYAGEDEGLQGYVLIGDLDVPRGRLSELARRGGLLASAGNSTVAEFLGV